MHSRVTRQGCLRPKAAAAQHVVPRSVSSAGRRSALPAFPCKPQPFVPAYCSFNGIVGAYSKLSGPPTGPSPFGALGERALEVLRG